jgi:hypothetical protein
MCWTSKGPPSGRPADGGDLTVNGKVRRSWILILAAVILGTVVGAAMSYYRYESDSRIYAFAKPSASKLHDVLAPGSRGSEAGRARLVIDEGSTYDFGIMSRNERRSHTFVLRNQGTGPLRLTFLDKTCQCTDVTMTRNEIAPGEATEITMTWQPSTFNLDFQQSARFQTNDPARIELDLTVRGKVQQVVQSLPRSISFGDVTAGQVREQNVKVFAYRDRDLTVTGVELSDLETAPFFETEVQPVDESTLAAETGAVAGQQIVVRLKPGLALGRFRQRLRVYLSDPELGPLEVPVDGNVVGNITLFGNGYDPRAGYWNLGHLSGDQEHSRTLYILVKGEDATKVQLQVAEVEPADVLSVELQAMGSVNKIARHALKLTVRPQGGVVNRLGNDQGDLAEIVLESTHPDVPQIRIPVSFALEAQP